MSGFVQLARRLTDRSGKGTIVLVSGWPDDPSILAQSELKSAIGRVSKGQQRNPLRLFPIEDASTPLDRLRIEIAVRLYGYDGVCFHLGRGPATNRDGLERMAALADLCRELDTRLVIVTCQRHAAIARLSRGGFEMRLGQPRLGRSRRTTSTRAISMPSGGSGSLPTSMALSSISIRRPSPST